MEYSKEFLERLREEIILDEGCVLEVYKDHLGYFTVGVGHLIRPSDEEWGHRLCPFRHHGRGG